MNSAVILIAIAEIIVAIAVINLGVKLNNIRKDLLSDIAEHKRDFYSYQESELIRWLQLKNDVSSYQRDCDRLKMQLYEINPNVGKYTYGGEKE